MTVSGAVIAVGNICGAEVFGQDFINATAAISREIARQIQLREIEEQLQSLPTVRDRAERLLKGQRGAEWLERAEQSLRRICPPRILSALYDRAANRNPTIEFTRERTKYDPPALMGQSRKYITEHFGTLRGLGALREPSPRVILETRVLSSLTTYSTQTPGSLIDNKPLLKRFSEWYHKLPIELSTAESRLLDAPLFFETSNLRQLSHLARYPNDRQMLGHLIWNDAKGSVQVEGIAQNGTL